MSQRFNHLLIITAIFGFLDTSVGSAKSTPKKDKSKVSSIADAPKVTPSDLSSLESQFKTGGISFSPSGKINYTSDWKVSNELPLKLDRQGLIAHDTLRAKFESDQTEDISLNRSGIISWNARVEDGKILSFTQCSLEGLMFPQCVTVNGELCRLLLKESNSKDYNELLSKVESCTKIFGAVAPTNDPEKTRLSEALAREESRNKNVLIEAFPEDAETYQKGESPLFKDSRSGTSSLDNLPTAVFQKWKPTMINYAAGICAQVKFSEAHLDEKPTSGSHQ
jgi:hypothetical protein